MLIYASIDLLELSVSLKGHQKTEHRKNNWTKQNISQAIPSHEEEY